MNKAKLAGVMIAHGDTQETLSQAIGLSLSRFNAKLNERDGASFTQPEIAKIVQRYNLCDEVAMEIFFAKEVS